MRLADTNACVTFLRKKSPKLSARWKAVKSGELLLCSVVVYELRYGAELSSKPLREHGILDSFLPHFVSLPFDDKCARKCAEIRRALEVRGETIGPYDLMIAATALVNNLILITHNMREFGRISGLKLEDWEAD